MQTIIAPTNFSDNSLNAVNYAADLATFMGANLLLLNIVPLDLSYEVPIDEYLYEEMVQTAQKKLDKIKEELIKKSVRKINITAKAILSTVYQGVEKECDLNKPFLVVIGTSKENKTEHLLFGRKDFVFLNNLKYPVLAIPSNGSFKPVKKIILASDLKNIYEVPIQFLNLLIKIFDASFTIVHVSKLRKKASDEINMYLLRKELKELHPAIDIVIANNIDEGIKSYAHKNNDDLIILMNRHYSLPEILIHKSEGKAILSGSEKPILKVPEL